MLKFSTCVENEDKVGSLTSFDKFFVLSSDLLAFPFPPFLVTNSEITVHLLVWRVTISHAGMQVQNVRASKPSDVVQPLSRYQDSRFSVVPLNLTLLPQLLSFNHRFPHTSDSGLWFPNPAMNLKRPSIARPVSICTQVTSLNPGSWHQINYRMAGG